MVATHFMEEWKQWESWDGRLRDWAELYVEGGLPGWLSGKESTCQCRVKDRRGGWGRSWGQPHMSWNKSLPSPPTPPPTPVLQEPQPSPPSHVPQTRTQFSVQPWPTHSLSLGLLVKWETWRQWPPKAFQPSRPPKHSLGRGRAVWTAAEAPASLESGPGLCHCVNMMQACLVPHSCGFLFSPAVATRPGCSWDSPAGGRGWGGGQERALLCAASSAWLESLQKGKKHACVRPFLHLPAPLPKKMGPF